MIGVPRRWATHGLPPGFADPKLPLLGALFDLTTLSDRFNVGLRRRGMDPAWTVARCAVEEVYYHHAKQCGALYRLTLRHDSGEEQDEWVFARMLRRWRLAAGFDEVRGGPDRVAGVRTALARVPPVTLWDDLDTILWIFPRDARLSGLERAADPAVLQQEIDRGLVADDPGRPVIPSGSRCRSVTVDRVKYMPEERCVLRIRAEIDGPDPSQFRQFYSKTYPDGESAQAFRIQLSASEQLAAQDALLRVPRPIHHFEAASTLWLEDMGGTPFLEAAASRPWIELATLAARTVAELHRSRIEGIGAARESDVLLAAALRDAARVAARVPAWGPLTARMLAGLEPGLPQGAPIPAVPTHGACRSEQMLLCGERAALIDFDSLACGDPLFDVAEFVMSLHFLELSGVADLDATQATERFLECYAAEVPWPCDRRRIAWYALASMSSKMHAAVKQLETETLGRLESKATALATSWLGALAG